MAKSRKALDSMFEIAMSMEEPLNAALDLTQAFYLMGLGLESVDDDGGKPTLALAEALSGRLADVKDGWDAIIEAGAKRRA